MNRAQLSAAQGFSLMELLVAMMLFSLLTAFAYRAVSFLSESSVALESEQEELTDVNKTLNFMERDLRTANISSLRLAKSLDEYYEGGEKIVVSVELMNKVGGPDLVTYVVQKNSITRGITQSGAEDEKNPVEPLVLLSDEVDALDVELIASSSDSLAKDDLPIGVNINLEHQRLGKLSRTIFIDLAMADPELDTLSKKVFSGEGPQDILPGASEGEGEVVTDEVDEAADGW